MNLSLCYAGDFETTTDENDLRVWAFSLSNVENQEFIYGTTIEEFFQFCMGKFNYKIWFHNLKFDGAYIISYLLKEGFTWIEDRKDKADKTFTTLIGDLGQFYSIVVYFKVRKYGLNKVEFYDSLKIFPNFSVERVADAFKLPLKKLKIDYHKKREVGYELDEDEIAYIKNDVEIMSLALKEMFKRGLTKMTIASDAISDLKTDFDKFRKIYPILKSEVDRDVRKSYKGGFTYVNECWIEKEVGDGMVLDVNSLYPSCMCSPYELPYGQPVKFEGKYEKDEIYPLYIQSIICYFELKEGKIPSIQVKNNLSFMPNEYVKSSNGEYVKLYLTKPDFELFCSQYNIYEPIYNGGWKFKASVGNFDSYINRWMERKVRAGKEGNASLKTISKLMLNSAYGKLGCSPKGKQKKPVLDEDGVLRFELLDEEEREALYVPAASYITSYGRFRTITTSQMIRDYTLKKYGEDRYYYSDTDSIHAGITDEDLEELKDVIQVDDFKIGCWAKEDVFTRAYYIRQKCYIEEIDGKVKVTVAGLPKYLAPLITFENFKRGFSTEGLDLEDLRRIARENGGRCSFISRVNRC